MGLFVLMKLDAIIKKFNVNPDPTTESWKVHKKFGFLNLSELKAKIHNFETSYKEALAITQRQPNCRKSQNQWVE